MILGLGIDLVEIERFARQLAQTPSLKQRLFAESEYQLSIESLAARFAAKEALAKALGDPRLLSWVEIELTKDELDKPILRLSGATKTNVEARGVRGISVSLTHTEQTAAAVVILED